MTPETKLKNKFKHLLKTANPEMMIISLSERYQSGLPDMMTINSGNVSFYELKAPKGRVTPSQHIQMRRLTNAGAACYIVKGTPFKFDIIPFEIFDKQKLVGGDSGTNRSDDVS